MKDIVIKMPLEELPDSFRCLDNGHVARYTHIIVDGHDISGAVTGFEVERPTDDFSVVTLTLVGRVVFEDTRDDIQRHSKMQSNTELIIESIERS
jgi:hypothetical protein